MQKMGLIDQTTDVADFYQPVRAIDELGLGGLSQTFARMENARGEEMLDPPRKVPLAIAMITCARPRNGAGSSRATNLALFFPSPTGPFCVLDDVSLEVKPVSSCASSGRRAAARPLLLRVLGGLVSADAGLRLRERRASGRTAPGHWLRLPARQPHALAHGAAKRDAARSRLRDCEHSVRPPRGATARPRGLAGLRRVPIPRTSPAACSSASSSLAPSCTTPLRC